jgi:hypothetical protein
VKPRVRLAVAGVVLAAGCVGPLPEQGTPDAALYEARCGTCHRAFRPHTLTASMWKIQVDRMNTKYRANGMLPPTPAEREKIVAYLVRNAGG